MIHYPKLLIIGGDGRNIGKTELACRLISRIAREREVYGLKVSAIYPDEWAQHGSHEGSPPAGGLHEERRTDSHKDSSRMLRAGASRVFYLQATDDQVAAGFAAFLEQLTTNPLVVCESNSLGLLVQPGLLVMVRGQAGVAKERAAALTARCDLQIDSDGRSGFPGSDRIIADPTGWRLH